MNKLILTRKEDKKYAFFYENDVLTELDISKDGYDSLVGNIYVGQVKAIQSNIHAAFVAINQNKNGFLPLADVNYRDNKLKNGEYITVQIDKDAVKSKDPVLTTKLSLKGEYCVVQLFEQRIGFSGKLSKERKSLLKADLEPKLKRIQANIKEGASLDIGIIIRTSCGENSVSYDEIYNEVDVLANQLIDIYIKSKSRALYSMMYDAGNFWIQKYKHFNSFQIDEMITDQKDCFEMLSMGISDTNHTFVRFYEDETYPLSALYSLSTRIEEATAKKVWLKCGGYLVIEETEALVVIDVNSGKNISGKDKELTFQKVNCEAAIECARQFRLRNFNGIIIIDFINCKDNSKFISLLKDEIRKDPIKTVFVDITPLGLVELTRQKKTRPLSEKI